MNEPKLYINESNFKNISLLTIIFLKLLSFMYSLGSFIYIYVCIFYRYSNNKVCPLWPVTYRHQLVLKRVYYEEVSTPL